MSEPQLQFHFKGSESRDAANELAQLLRDELPDWQSQLAEKAPSTEVERVDPLTVIAVMSLILSVPPAIQSSWDLAQRIKLKEKIDRLIAWAKARSAQGKIIPTVVLPHEGSAVPLDQAAPQQLLDAIASQSSPQKT
jgi:hypothetical protein